MDQEKLVDQVSLINDEETWNYVNGVVNLRNSEYTCFVNNNNRDLHVSSASEVPVFETSSSSDVDNNSYDNALDMELERLRLQERSLRDDINKQTISTNILNTKTSVQEQKIKSKINELQKQVVSIRNLRKETQRKNGDLKDEIKNITLTTKELVDRLAFPKAIIRKSLKVSEDDRCQNEDFCREFSGGKCLSDTRRKKNNT